MKLNPQQTKMRTYHVTIGSPGERSVRLLVDSLWMPIPYMVRFCHGLVTWIRHVKKVGWWKSEQTSSQTKVSGTAASALEQYCRFWSMWWTPEASYCPHMPWWPLGYSDVALCRNSRRSFQGWGRLWDPEDASRQSRPRYEVDQERKQNVLQ